MRIKSHCASLCVFVVLMGGCALTDTRKKDSARFETTIYPNNTKQFTFTVAAKGKGARQGKGAQGVGYSGRGKGEAYDKSMERERRKNRSEEGAGMEIDQPWVGKLKEFVYSKLAQTLKEKPFCHRGFVEIDNYFFEGYGYIKAQCNDKATPEDWQQFPNAQGFSSSILLRKESATFDGEIESIPIYP